MDSLQWIFLWTQRIGWRITKPCGVDMLTLEDCLVKRVD